MFIVLCQIYRGAAWTMSPCPLVRVQSRYESHIAFGRQWIPSHHALVERVGGQFSPRATGIHVQTTGGQGSGTMEQVTRLSGEAANEQSCVRASGACGRKRCTAWTGRGDLRAMKALSGAELKYNAPDLSRPTFVCHDCKHLRQLPPKVPARRFIRHRAWSLEVKW